jgi:hypothetical protein
MGKIDHFWSDMSLQFYSYSFNYYIASITMPLQLLCRFNSITMSLQLYYYIPSITMSLQLYYYVPSITMSLQLLSPKNNRFFWSSEVTNTHVFRLKWTFIAKIESKSDQKWPFLFVIFKNIRNI